MNENVVSQNPVKTEPETATVIMTPAVAIQEELKPWDNLSDEEIVERLGGANRKTREIHKAALGNRRFARR